MLSLPLPLPLPPSPLQARHCLTLAVAHLLEARLCLTPTMAHLLQAPPPRIHHFLMYQVPGSSVWEPPTPRPLAVKLLPIPMPGGEALAP